MPTEFYNLQTEIPALNALALRSLVSLFDEKDGLFCRSVRLKQDGFHREATSPKRTAIALLGLHRLAESGANLPFDLSFIRKVVFGDVSWVGSLGDLGLLTWSTALCEPERLKHLFRQFDFRSALDRYWDARQAQTRGLAWFLAGIAHARLTAPETTPDLTEVAAIAYKLLEANKSESGIFGHSTFPGLLKRTFCKRFGTFGDQIYAIYGLSTFARAFQIEEALDSALNCGNAMCALQGGLGEWWFLYDKRNLRVPIQYPVFSLHQTGTAPMALLALGEAAGQGFHAAIHKSLSWTMGANELGQDLRDPDRSIIWDSIEARRSKVSYLDAALSLIGSSRTRGHQSLRIRYRARPDHFGWLLYALGTHGLPI